MLPEPIRQKIEAIRADNINGAVALTRQAADALIAAIDHPIGEPPASPLPQIIGTTAQALVDAQPTMAPIFNLGNRVLWAVDPLQDADAIRQSARQQCQAFLAGLKRAGHAVGVNAADLIEDGMTVMTHSASSMVLQALRLAWRTGKQFEIICTEARPMGEGIKLAETLGREGMPVTLIVDAAAFALLPETGLVFVGADCVTPGGLVNKSGTLGLALAAQAMQVAFYGLCGSEKFLPADDLLPPEPPKTPTEIVAQPPAGVTILNFYFDQTPLDALTGVVTEEGVLATPELRARFETIKIHPLLRAIGED